MCLKHLHGRTWRGTEGEAKKVALLRQESESKVPEVNERASHDLNEHHDKSRSAIS
jgi:hypothetical protein